MKPGTITWKGLAIMIMCFSFACSGGPVKDDSRIKIGVVIPLSGNGATIGNYSREGVQLAVDEVNAAGGLMGKQIELDIQDSKSDPKEGVNIIKNMLGKGENPFMVYSIISGVTMAIRPETENNKVILMGAVGTDKFIVNASYTIRSYVSASNIAHYIAPFVRDSLKIRKLSIFYANNEYSTSVKNAVESKCREAGLEIGFTVPFDEKTPDYKSLVTASITPQTECIFIDGIGNGMGTMIRQIRESGYTGPIVSDPIIKFPDVITAAGDAINGVYYMDFAYDENCTENACKTFVDNYRTKFNSSPANFAVISYQGMKMLLEKVNAIQSLDSDKIIAAMNEVKDYQGIFGPVAVKDRELQFNYTYKRFKK